MAVMIPSHQAAIAFPNILPIIELFELIKTIIINTGFIVLFFEIQ